MKDQFKRDQVTCQTIRNEIDGLILERNFIVQKLPSHINLGMFTIKLDSIKSDLVTRINKSLETFHQVYIKKLNVRNTDCYELYAQIRAKLKAMGKDEL